ncbi:MAG: acyl-CoA thioesterase [Chloroflexaceae bacterium]|nr:acyl-CoA thioesterase [Chloroflexaceae bacterium]
MNTPVNQNPPEEDLPARVAPEVYTTDLVLPSQTNYYHTMFGGDAMAMMDKTAAIAALRFCRQPIVTASSEHIDFREPVYESEIIEARARVIFAGRSSLVVRVHVYGENALNGNRRLCTTGYFNMVSITPEGKAMPLHVRLLLEDESSHEEWLIGKRIHEAIVARREQYTRQKPGKGPEATAGTGT